MEYILPNSTIELYKGVELDNTYEHTFYFENEAQRDTTLFGGGSSSYHVISRIDNAMYQIAKDTGRIRIAMDRMKFTNGTAYDINYMRFRNTSYENKWFYAFVTEVNYLNDKVCELTYELDYMVTFFFDYNLGTSYVEREHSIDDSVASCLVPESLETGEYTFTRALHSVFDNTYKVLVGQQMAVRVEEGYSMVLAANDSFLPKTFFDVDPPSVPFARIDGLPTSNRFPHEWFNRYDSTNDAWEYNDNGLQNFYNTNIGNYVSHGKTDALLGLYLYPTCLLPDPLTSVEFKDPNLDVYVLINRNSDVDGYAPFNKKLFTYPYNFVYVRDYNGNANVYKFEYTNFAQMQFQFYGNISATPSICLVPLNYKNTPDNFDEAMLITNVPQLSIATDAYKQWLAENGVMTALNGMRGALQGLSHTATASSGNGVTGAGLVSTGMSIASSMAAYHQAMIQPNQTLTGSSATALTAVNTPPFLVGIKSVNATMAESIDNYFSMFGYACRKTKVPSRHNRSRWTYTKTIGCVLTGDVPNMFLKKITEVFDKGITFWVTSEKGHVGDYTQQKNVRENSVLVDQG